MLTMSRSGVDFSGVSEKSAGRCVLWIKDKKEHQQIQMPETVSFFGKSNLHLFMMTLM